MIRSLSLRSSVSLAVVSLAACGGGGSNESVTASGTVAGSGTVSGTGTVTTASGTAVPPRTVPVGDTVALTAGGRLISFNRATPETLVGSIAVAGVAQGETLLGIDHRPSDGKLYALSSAGMLYQLDAATGMATPRAALRAAAGDDNPYTALSGTNFGFDFNPAADRLRVVSDTGQSLRINVDTGDTITDGAINPAGVAITASGYTNSFAGTSGTQLFGLDVMAGRLHLQDPPNAGTLNAGVTLGVSAEASNGFDIDARTNTGFAVLRTGGQSVLYRINLAATADAATRVGTVGESEAIRGIALAPAAAPTALALTSNNQLVAFNPRSPNALTGTVAVTGLGTGESMVGIDYRPRDGLLWGLSSTGRLYTIDSTTGAATFRAALVADPADTTSPYTGLGGTVTAVDFNPVADRLRVNTSDGQNLRIVVETATVNGATVTAGHTTTDGPLSRASGAASVVASAYTNSFAGTTATSLYNLEQNANQLTLQNPPNNGTLADVGPLGVDIAGNAGFDIGGGANGLSLAALRSGASGPFLLYSISLTTGAATLYGNAAGNAALSQIGGANGPANLIDLAIRF